jgi:hypothetical protein
MLFRRRTSMEALGEWQARRPGLQPTGFIFHTTRCGSTLISQMLAALPQNLVLSGPDPIDAVLRAKFQNPDLDLEQQVEWLRWIIGGLGQAWGGAERHFFIKFDCWNTPQLPLVRRAFPDVPWVFVYRDPVAVLVSQLRQRGAGMVPSLIAPEVYDVDVTREPPMPPEEYCSRVLGQVCKAALDHHRQTGTGTLLNYSQLPQAVWSSLATTFGVTLADSDIDRMRRAAQADARNRVLPFTDDKAEKRCLASERARQMADQWVRPVYDQLEDIRQHR